MDLIDRHRGIVLAQVLTAESLFKKIFGLTVGKPLGQDQCFLIKSCKSIHTIGMRYAIDAMFLDQTGRVLKVFEHVRPYRVTPFIKKAQDVVEFRAGFTARKGISRGLHLAFVETD